MHDISKYMTESELLERGIRCDGATRALPESCRHQATGAAVARLCLGETDEDVLSAIATHTTGAENMSTLQKIIFAADYIEEGRDFDGLEKIRATVYDDLDRGVAAILGNTVKYLRANGMEIAPVTLRAYEKANKENL